MGLAASGMGITNGTGKGTLIKSGCPEAGMEMGIDRWHGEGSGIEKDIPVHLQLNPYIPTRGGVKLPPGDIFPCISGTMKDGTVRFCDFS